MGAAGAAGAPPLEQLTGKTKGKRSKRAPAGKDKGGGGGGGGPLMQLADDAVGPGACILPGTSNAL